MKGDIGRIIENNPVLVTSPTFPYHAGYIADILKDYPNLVDLIPEKNLEKICSLKLVELLIAQPGLLENEIILRMSRKLDFTCISIIREIHEWLPLSPRKK